MTKREALDRLTERTLKSIDKRLPKSERDFWQRQAWFMAKRIEGGQAA